MFRQTFSITIRLVRNQMPLNMKTTLVLLTHIVLACGINHEAERELAHFVASNVNKPVAIVCRKHPNCHWLSKSFMKTFFVPTRQVQADSMVTVDDDFNIFLETNPVLAALEGNLQLIAKSKVKSSLLYFPRELTNGDWRHLQFTLSSMRQSSHFYVVSGVDAHLKWHVVITLKGQTDVAITELQFVSGTHHIKSDYNLQGMRISSIAKNWIPYLSFDGDFCDGERTYQGGCGSLIDLSLIMARLFNFTLVSVQEDGGWGVTPVKGAYNASGTWTGVMGNVINGIYPMSLSSWQFVPERSDFLDCVTLFLDDKQILLMTPRVTKTDHQLYIRPFTNDVWRTIAGTSALIGATSIACHACISKFHSTNAQKLMFVTVSYFLVLLNAFYGGALTMFFASEPNVPFQTINDVIRSGDDWKLLILKGITQPTRWLTWLLCSALQG